ncbi:hypothetical protein OPQ81_005070 [Rhizoctonia solani]|nr:hypothetical protein OPQ81_005070 [Rhizoctonia solani]
MQVFIDRLTELNKSLQLPASDGSRQLPEEIEKLLHIELEAIKQASYMNPLLDMPSVDIHQDTPTELLHTISPGFIQYFWAQMVHILEKEKLLHILESRLASLSVQGLEIGKLPAR